MLPEKTGNTIREIFFSTSYLPLSHLNALFCCWLCQAGAWDPWTMYFTLMPNHAPWEAVIWSCKWFSNIGCVKDAQPDMMAPRISSVVAFNSVLCPDFISLSASFHNIWMSNKAKGKGSPSVFCICTWLLVFFHHKTCVSLHALPCSPEDKAVTSVRCKLYLTYW